MSSEMEEYKHYMALPQMIAVSTLIDARIRETGTLMARVKELEDIVHGIGKLLEENGHTVTFTLKANRLITKCHELFRTENK